MPESSVYNILSTFLDIIDTDILENNYLSQSSHRFLSLDLDLGQKNISYYTLS